MQITTEDNRTIITFTSDEMCELADLTEDWYCDGLLQAPGHNHFTTSYGLRIQMADDVAPEMGTEEVREFNLAGNVRIDRYGNPLGISRDWIKGSR